MGIKVIVHPCAHPFSSSRGCFGTQAPKQLFILSAKSNLKMVSFFFVISIDNHMIVCYNLEKESFSGILLVPQAVLPSSRWRAYRIPLNNSKN